LTNKKTNCYIVLTNQHDQLAFANEILPSLVH